MLLDKQERAKQIDVQINMAKITRLKRNNVQEIHAKPECNLPRHQKPACKLHLLELPSASVLRSQPYGLSCLLLSK